ncbi:MAG: SIS domain-containing protein [Sulfolobales archaeon]
MGLGYVYMYRDVIHSIFERILSEEMANMERASEEMAMGIMNDRLIYVLGTGHSMLVAVEMFHRAGGLARIYPMLDTALSPFSGAAKSSMIERLSGYADALIEYYSPSEGDVLIVISNSGKNAVPVEASVLARERGVRVIAITSVEYSKKLEPENRYGKKLYEVADIVVDNKVPEGDAAVEIKELGGRRIAPVSTIVNSFIAHTLEILAIEKLIKRGYEPEIWVSVNIPHSKDLNRMLLEKYKKYVKHL